MPAHERHNGFLSYYTPDTGLRNELLSGMSVEHRKAMEDHRNSLILEMISAVRSEAWIDRID